MKLGWEVGLCWAEEELEEMEATEEDLAVEEAERGPSDLGRLRKIKIK